MFDCGQEPGGNFFTTPSTTFTPTCPTTPAQIAFKPWYNLFYVSVDEGATSLTDGLFNTNQLMASASPQNNAAAYCYHMSLNGKTDWYLPAREEMRVLANKHIANGLTSGDYWTSSESGGLHAWTVGLTAGGVVATNTQLKLTGWRIQCVRRAN